MVQIKKSLLLLLKIRNDVFVLIALENFIIYYNIKEGSQGKNLQEQTKFSNSYEKRCTKKCLHQNSIIKFPV